MLRVEEGSDPAPPPPPPLRALQPVVCEGLCEMWAGLLLKVAVVVGLEGGGSLPRTLPLYLPFS